MKDVKRKFQREPEISTVEILVGESIIASNVPNCCSSCIALVKLVIAVDKDFQNFAGFAVLASNETPGFGDKIKLPYYRDQFANAPAQPLDVSKTGDNKIIDSQIVAITGATVSSEAVVEIINNAAKQIREEMLQKGFITNVK